MSNKRCTEPSLDELFGDIAMQLLMRRDGVTESDIRALLCQVKGIRAAALGSIKRKPIMRTSGALPPDQTETSLRSPTAKLSETRKMPLRFI
jgi:hypothetical protein